MTVFITGATGYIGSSVAHAFLARNHRVIGLTRSRAKAEELARAGVEPVIGSIADSALLQEMARQSDVAVHAAVDYGPDPRALDESGVTAMLTGLNGGGRLLDTSRAAGGGRRRRDEHLADGTRGGPRTCLCGRG